MEVRVLLNAQSIRARRIHVENELGEPLVARVDFATDETIDGEQVVGTPVRIDIVADDGTAVAHQGVVASITSRATLRADTERVYSADIRSAIELLSLRRTSRIFREKNAVDVVKELLAGVGIVGEAVATEIADPPPVRPHVTQWAETDARFLRRICEEEGLYFRFDPADGFDTFVLCDNSKDAPLALEAPLVFADAAGLRTEDIVAFHAKVRRARRPGKVTLRDFDPAKPSLNLEGVAEGGLDPEKTVEVYRAPGRFRSEDEGKRSARLVLESLRADATVLEFESRAFALRPGTSFEADPQAPNAPTGKFFVVSTTFDWEAGQGVGSLRATAIPLDVPFRLPRRTPRPRVAGILSATVTGAAGEEVHTDEAAKVKVSFVWDREGPKDDKASLPIRVMQPNVPGSMLLPRVGWEVLVGFEDGDPDRPVVLGRSFNGKQRPPFGLPANKTMTAIGSVSSPGAGRQNMISLDDAAGRQHMTWHAGFGKTTVVGADMSNQTVGFDQTHIKGNQTWNVSGDETVSVENAWAVSVGSQTATIGGDQTLTIKATASRAVGSETVVIGGALVEKVGNPVDGLAGFAKAAVIAGVSQIPGVGPVLTKAYSWGNAMYQGYKTGGWDGVASAAAQSAVGEVAGRIPGGDAIVAAANGAGLTPWSEKARARAAEQQGGGGGGGAGGAGAGAAAAAPGHRKLVVDGVVTEVIGAVHAIQTPGSLKWSTMGASTFDIGASHATSALRISRLTMARSSDVAAVMRVTAKKAIGRNVKTAHTLKAGTIKLDAGGPVGFKAKAAMKIEAGGAATVDGGTVVFEVGGSSVSIHGGGVTLASSQITINGKTQHAKKEHTG